MSWKNIIFEKLLNVENDLGSCSLQITVIFASPNINKKYFRL